MLTRPLLLLASVCLLQARYKKTELCHTCAKLKNCCQTCILDLQFGLPLAVRDQALAEHEKLSMPKSDVGRGYMIEQIEREQDMLGSVGQTSVVDMSTVQKGSMLDRLAKRAPYYKRNLAHRCSFFARGECNRGVLCPFLHEMPPDSSDGMGQQNFKDRYYGNNDPVARKMLRRATSSPGLLNPPDDKSITTLWVGGLDAETTEDDLRSRFYPFGELQSIRVVPAKSCAFVTFQNRVAAEEAAKKLHEKLQIRGQPVKMSWGKPKGEAGPGAAGNSGAALLGSYSGSSAAAAAASSSGGPPGMAGPPGVSRPSAPPGISFPAPPPGIGQLHLAAADPRQNASKLPM